MSVFFLAWSTRSMDIYICVCVWIYIYIYVCVCVCDNYDIWYKMYIVIVLGRRFLTKYHLPLLGYQIFVPSSLEEMIWPVMLNAKSLIKACPDETSKYYNFCHWLHTMQSSLSLEMKNNSPISIIIKHEILKDRLKSDTWLVLSRIWLNTVFLGGEWQEIKINK